MQVKMVTGDQHAIAVETSRRLGLGVNIMDGAELLSAKATNREFAQHVEAMDGFAGVFPEHKHRIVEAVQSTGRLVGMTGIPLCNIEHILIRQYAWSRACINSQTFYHLCCFGSNSRV